MNEQCMCDQVRPEFLKQDLRHDKRHENQAGQVMQRYDANDSSPHEGVAEIRDSMSIDFG